MKIFKLSENSRIPTIATKGSAGYDLYASENLLIKKRSRGIVPTGIGIILKDYTYGRVCPRSGLAVKSGIDVGAGVIDSDYRGEVKVVLFNHSDTDFQVNVGDRIAQLVVVKIEKPQVLVAELSDIDTTRRGTGGFGSTGII